MNKNNYKQNHNKIKRDKIIKDHFMDQYELKGISAFDESMLSSFFDDKKTSMKMRSFSMVRFIKYLVDNGFLKVFEFRNEVNHKIIYTTKYFDQNSDYAKVLEISTLILPRSYISYFSAMYFYHLTEQLPKKLFLSIERKSHAIPQELQQENIDKALCKEGRLPKVVMQILGYDIYLINAKEANRAGIKTVRMFNKNYRITTLDRTLIDIVVRAEISGGMQEVIGAYQQAIEEYKKDISINKIIFLLKKLEYIYPYHQVIAYLLHRNGIDVSKIKKEFEFKYDFYLTRGEINSKRDDLIYDSEFRIFVPRKFIELS